jgi:hypothetical protein
LTRRRTFQLDQANKNAANLIREHSKNCRQENRRSARAQGGVRHQAQARLRLLGHARENKRNMVARVFAAGTGDDHTAALNPAAVARRL